MCSTMKQDQIFYDREGDQWFLRNVGFMANSGLDSSDPVMRLMELSGLTPKRLLDVGGSNGYRAHKICEQYACCATVVEPSEQALDDGKVRYPQIEFLRGLASEIPISGEGGFDLVIVSSVLHWIDRARLMRSAAEIDRLLQDGGHLLIGDFLPSLPQRVPYHHLPTEKVYTFKQNYSEMFVASNLYETVATLSIDHHSKQPSTSIPPSDRWHVALLKKTLSERYANAAFAA